MKQFYLGENGNLAYLFHSGRVYGDNDSGG